MSDQKKSYIETQEEERKTVESEQLIPKTTSSCECSNREIVQAAREKEVSSSIAFEDALHNRVYVRRESTTRSKRHTSILHAIPKKRDTHSYPQVTKFLFNNLLLSFHNVLESWLQ